MGLPSAHPRLLVLKAVSVALHRIRYVGIDTQWPSSDLGWLNRQLIRLKVDGFHCSTWAACYGVRKSLGIVTTLL
jgi:hypothetical protein